MDGLVARAPIRAIINEVRRVPELFLPLKVEVDRRRVPGRFLLTGSANVLVLPKVADSLARRMGSIRLHPMAQCEIERREPKFLRGGGGQGDAPTVARGGPTSMIRATRCVPKRMVGWRRGLRRVPTDSCCRCPNSPTR